MGLRRPLHARVTCDALDRLLPALLERGIPPEIALGETGAARLAGSGAAALAAALAAAGLPASVHGPFSGLDPGSAAPGVRAHGLDAMRAALRAVAPLRPLTVVFHPGLPAGASAQAERGHTARAVETWHGLLPLPPGLEETWIAIENIYETRPEPLARLLRELPSPPFGFCLDAGHAQMFSRAPLEAWFTELGERLREIHLHDNRGLADEHLPPGRGTIDFGLLLRLAAAVPHPVVGTLELNSLAEILEGSHALAEHAAR